MTIDEHPLFLATWSGTIGEEEIFSYHRYVLDLDDHGLDARADQLETSVTDMLAQAVTGSLSIATLGELFPAHVVWTQLKVATINPVTGKYLSPDDVVTRVLDDAGSGVSADGLPYQCAFSVTTRSSHSKSPKENNRFYLPCPVWRAFDGHGDMQAPVMAAINLWMSLGQTSAQADTPPYSFVNYSPADHTAKIQVDVNLGSRIDTIRRRRNHAPETRVVQALDAPAV